jgi:hypothetical protein
LVVLAGLSSLAAATVTGRRVGVFGILGLFGGGQFLGHVALTVLSAPSIPWSHHLPVVASGHAAHAAHAAAPAVGAPGLATSVTAHAAGHTGATMMWAHVVASALTAALVLYGEAALWALWSALRPRVLPTTAPAPHWAGLRLAAAGPLLVAKPAPAFRWPQLRGPPVLR